MGAAIALQDNSNPTPFSPHGLTGVCGAAILGFGAMSVNKLGTCIMLFIYLHGAT